MSLSWLVFITIVGCMAVTAVPRVLPFLLIRSFILPNIIIRWLSYIPICIFSALVISGIIGREEAGFVMDWERLLALFPTLVIALWTRNLLFTVVVGILTMAVIRTLL